MVVYLQTKLQTQDHWNRICDKTYENFYKDDALLNTIIEQCIEEATNVLRVKNEFKSLNFIRFKNALDKFLDSNSLSELTSRTVSKYLR